MATPEPAPDQRRGLDDLLRRRAERRRTRLRAGIQRSRSGDHRVPTWVLGATLALVLAGWLYLIITK